MALVDTPVANVQNVSFGMSGTNLRISWTGFGDTYYVRYHDTTTDDWTQHSTSTTDDTGITISGLTAGVQYSFEITTDDGVSDYYGYVIPSGAGKPTAFVKTAETPTTISLSWTKAGGSGVSNIVWWVDDEGNTDYIDQIAGNTLTVSELDPERYYFFYCGTQEGDDIQWADNYVDKQPECGCD